jgi:hypothetical protein
LTTTTTTQRKLLYYFIHDEEGNRYETTINTSENIPFQIMKLFSGSISSSNKTMKPQPDEDPIAARRKIEEEMARIQLETQQKRSQKMKELNPESPVRARRQGVRTSLEEFTIKGTREEEKKKLDLEQLKPVIVEECNLTARKQAYQTKLQEFTQKGKEHLPPDDLPSSPTKSPQKAYKSVVEQNAAKNDLSTPTLFAYDPVKDANEQVKQAAASKQGSSSTSSTSGTANPLTPKNWDGTTYSLIDLRQRNVPKDIDWKNREQYLTDTEFQTAFNMSKEEFAKQPKWKRDKLKQSLYLF